MQRWRRLPLVQEDGLMFVFAKFNFPICISKFGFGIETLKGKLQFDQVSLIIFRRRQTRNQHSWGRGCTS
jgi:hypothetical protein